MECNKEDAMKAKELAEKKILEMDPAGAKMFALEAQDLSPNLDGLPQLLATIEVYVSAERRINGKVDWYRVLGVDPMADDETIRRCYRKLALTPHPDKNKSTGADGAFKLISEAWNLLSDKAKKISYDQRRNFQGIYEGTPYGKPSVPAGESGFYNSFNRDPRSSAHPNPPHMPPVTPKQTFWTICNSCGTQFEYPSAYLNHSLVCMLCHTPFIAFAMPTPSIYRNTSYTSKGRMKKTPAKHSSETMDGSSPFFMPSGISSVPTASSFSGIDSNNNLKRGHEHKTPPVMMEEAQFGKTQTVKTTDAGSAFQSSCLGSNSVPKRDRPRKKRHIDKRREDNDRKEKKAVMASHNEGISMGDEHGSRKGSCETQRVNAAGNCKHNGMRDMPQQQIRKMLVDMARKDIRRKLDESGVASVLRNLDKSRNTNKEAKEKGKERSGNAVKSGAQECLEFVDSEAGGKNSSSGDTDILVAEATNSLSMSVPDPDFHDFDNDRTEKALGENQVWAVYDDDDGMPRYYALIHDVISLKPFKMKISWLNSKSNDELAPVKWIGYGFPKTIGDFRTGKHEFNVPINSFSHRVKWKKGSRGVINIYPKKGDVWALYRNWCPDWNELTPDEIVHKYDMVEVLDNYNEERGVDVAPLVKVAGFKTVFFRHVDPRNVRNIPRAEMFRLSHQVPAYLLTGQEGANAPRGCLELDPAALPMELLQVVTGAPEPGTETTIGKSSADPIEPRQNSGENEEVKAFQITKEKDSAEDISGGAVAEALKKKGNAPENLIVYKRRRTREKSEM